MSNDVTRWSAVQAPTEDDSTTSTAVNLPGGVVRVTTNRAAESGDWGTGEPISMDQHAAGGKGVLDGAATRVTANGVERVGGVTRVNAADLAPNTFGIMGTAQSAGGMARAFGRVDDTCTVELIPGDPSTRTNVKTAERLGYIVRLPGGGGFVEPNVSPQAAEKHIAERQAETHDNVEMFDAPTEAAIAKGLEGIDQGLVSSTLAHAAVHGFDGVNIQALAEQSGKSTAEVGQLVQTTATAFVNQAKAACKAAGVAESDFENFKAWAWQHRKEAASEAQLAHVYVRNTSAYKALAAEYLQANPPSVEALKRGGYQVSNKNGTDVVLIPGKGWMSLGAAARGKFI